VCRGMGQRMLLRFGDPLLQCGDSELRVSDPGRGQFCRRWGGGGGVKILRQRGRRTDSRLLPAPHVRRIAPSLDEARPTSERARALDGEFRSLHRRLRGPGGDAVPFLGIPLMLGDAAGCCIPIFLLHGREHGTTRKVRNTDTTGTKQPQSAVKVNNGDLQGLRCRRDYRFDARRGKGHEFCNVGRAVAGKLGGFCEKPRVLVQGVFCVYLKMILTSVFPSVVRALS